MFAGAERAVFPPDRSRLARKVAVVGVDAHENVMAGGPASRGDLRHGGSPSLELFGELTGKVARSSIGKLDRVRR